MYHKYSTHSTKLLYSDLTFRKKKEKVLDTISKLFSSFKSCLIENTEYKNKYLQ